MSVGSQSSSDGGLQQDAQVNIASIIDCFTVLITYILAAASFVSIGALDAGIAGTAVPSAISGAAAPAAPLPSMHIHVSGENQLSLSTGMGEQKSKSSIGFSDLSEKANAFKAGHPDLKTVTLSASDQIPYLDLVKIVSVLKQLQLSVVFSGNPEAGTGG